MSPTAADDWVLDEAEGLLDADGRRERLEKVVADLKPARSIPSPTPPRAIGLRSS